MPPDAPAPAPEAPPVDVSAEVADAVGQAPETPPEPETPRLSDLGALIAQRKAAEEAAKAKDAEAQELAELRRLRDSGQLGRPQPTPVDRLREIREEIRANPGLLRQAFDDPNEYRQVLTGAAKEAANPDLAALARQVEALKAGAPEGLDEFKAQLQQLMAAEQARAAATTEENFAKVFSAPLLDEDGTPEMVDGAPVHRFPLLNAHPRQQQIAMANGVLQRYAEAGVELTQEQLAGVLEQELGEYYERLSSVHRKAAPTAPEPSARTGGRPRRPKQGTRTITSDLASDRRAPLRKLTPKEREERAIANGKARRTAEG